MAHDMHAEPDPVRRVTDTEPDGEGPAPLRAKVVTGLVGIAVLFASGWLLLRVSSPAIAPGQKAPAGHYPLSCPICHPVSEAAPLKGEQ